MTTESTEGIRKSNRRWQSDVIVDLVKRYGFPYVALNPGASYRGLHDSLVNYGENDPPILLCNHEKIAVQIAHGYARASGKPMIAIVHDVVGLLHAPMGIYYAYLDRAPVFIIGATGPLAEPKRRPFIDWIHSANVQGEAIRHIVKWDYQPAAIDGVPDAFARAYSIMMSGRQGPIYMCYDAGLQEAELDHEVKLPPLGAVRVPAAPAPDPVALANAADALAAAERPVVIADFAARPPYGWEHVIAIAETLGAPVWDCNSRLNFPSNHPLNLSMAPKECYVGADVVLALDIADFEGPTHVRDIATRTVVNMVPETANSSRGVPHGPPLSHHRAYGSRTTAVSLGVQRGIPASRLVPVATPCQLAAPRTPSPRIPPGPGPPWRTVAFRTSSKRSSCSPVPCCRAAVIEWLWSAPWLRDSALHAFPLGRALLWPLLTPPRPSDAVADTLLRLSGEPRRPPTVRHCTFSGQPPDLPVRVTEGVLGVPVHGRVAPPHWPCIRFLFVGPLICLRLPPHPASLRRSCLWLSVPLLAARRGLSPPSSVPCVAHHGSTSASPMSRSASGRWITAAPSTRIIA